MEDARVIDFDQHVADARERLCEAITDGDGDSQFMRDVSIVVTSMDELQAELDWMADASCGNKPGMLDLAKALSRFERYPSYRNLVRLEQQVDAWECKCNNRRIVDDTVAEWGIPKAILTSHSHD